MENKKNTNAIVALVLGIVSIVLFVITILIQTPSLGLGISIIGIGLSITSIVCGCKGRKIVFHKGMAIFGFVCGIVGICLCAFSLFGCSTIVLDNNSYDNLYNNSYEEKSKTREEELKRSYLQLLETKKLYCENNYGDVSYSSLSRNPDNYKGDCIHFTGEVIQVLEDFDDNTAQLRVNTKKTNYDYIENYYSDDTIFVYVYNYNYNNRILEDDIIDLYGEYDGIVTYESVMGSKISIPSMIALEYDIK